MLFFEFIGKELELFYKILVFLIPAIPMTLKITILSFCLALVMGLLIGLARVSRINILRILAAAYVDIIRGVPLLVLIFFIYFGLGKVFNLPQFTAGIIAISICYSAYVGEIVRAGIQAISRGQYDAAQSLGMTNNQTMRHIILPQAFRIVLPPLVNDFVACLKDSSLVSIIGLRELTRAGREFYSQYFVAFETWFIIGLIYLAMTFVLSKFSAMIERKYQIRS
ncbi:MAG: amino acid ABC transporter permease [Elusimicrobiota bacterium]